MNAEGAARDSARNKLRGELAWMRKQPKARQAKSKAREERFYELKAKVPAGRLFGPSLSGRLGILSTGFPFEVLSVVSICLTMCFFGVCYDGLHTCKRSIISVKVKTSMHGSNSLLSVCLLIAYVFIVTEMIVIAVAHCCTFFSPPRAGRRRHPLVRTTRA